MPGFLKVYFQTGRPPLSYQNGLESGKAVTVTSENVRHQQSSIFLFISLLSVRV